MGIVSHLCYHVRLTIVLGGNYLGSTSTVNIDSFNGTGFVYVMAASSPSNTEGWLYQKQPKSGGMNADRTKIQEFRPYNSSDVYTRQFNWDTQTWASWVRMDAFGCSTPEALASLLGVQGRTYIDQHTLIDMDNLYIPNGILNVRIQGIDTLAGTHFNMSDAYGHLVSLGASNNCIQLFINPFEETPYLYVRSRWANTNDWFTFKVQLAKQSW